MDICIIDNKAPEDVKSELKRKFILIETLDYPGFTSPLGSHPDVQVCKIKEDFIIVAPKVYNYYKNQLGKYGIMVKSGIKEIADNYPEDSSYNLASNGNVGIHKSEITDPIILEEIENLIDVNQGYAKCNTAFTKEGIITSDKGIYNRVNTENKLLISPGHIKLQPYDYGFIGGATGYFDKMYFIGDVTKHPDYKKISEFLEREKTELKILGSGVLSDFGSLIFLKNRGGKYE